MSRISFLITFLGALLVGVANAFVSGNVWGKKLCHKTQSVSSTRPCQARPSTLVVKASSDTGDNDDDDDASSAGDDENDDAIDMANVGFVLLAGGKGSRMKASMPKQFLELCGAPILHHSLDLFLERLPTYLTQQGKSPPPYVVLVLDPMYQPDYQPLVDQYKGRLALANPGVERQGSVENGLAQLVELSQGQCEYAAVHDSARPLVTIREVCHVVRDALDYGASVLGVPCKATIKESEDGTTVLRTIPRSRLWEVHTPQVVKVETLQRGFAKVEAENLEVTDDVSIVEALGEPVKLTLGEYTNLKITTPEDLDVAKAILDERAEAPVTNLLEKQEA